MCFQMGLVLFCGLDFGWDLQSDIVLCYFLEIPPSPWVFLLRNLVLPPGLILEGFLPF